MRYPQSKNDMTRKFIALIYPFLAIGALAQQPPASPSEADRLQTRLARDEKILQDWPNLARYCSENATIQAPAPTEERIVFLGDSITDFWGRTRGKFFPGKPYINRGISGQTTPQMLIRFR